MELHVAQLALSWIGSHLEMAANCVEILTGAVALAAFTFYNLNIARKRGELERYLQDALKSDKKNGKSGHRSVIHLMSKLSLTEAEIFQISFKSKHIKPVIIPNGETGIAEQIMFRYSYSKAHDDGAIIR